MKRNELEGQGRREKKTQKKRQHFGASLFHPTTLLILVAMTHGQIQILSKLAHN